MIISSFFVDPCGCKLPMFGIRSGSIAGFTAAARHDANACMKETFRVHGGSQRWRSHLGKFSWRLSGLDFSSYSHTSRTHLSVGRNNLQSTAPGGYCRPFYGQCDRR